jgi:hypothetical protein
VNVLSIEDANSEGPFTGMQPNAGGRWAADNRDVLLVIGESNVLHVDPTTDSVCKGRHQRWYWAHRQGGL